VNAVIKDCAWEYTKDMDNPLVSVIIPFYNREKLLERAIKSVLAQTYTNWEIILIDDGSKDNSVLVVRKFIENMPERIFLVQQANAGEGSARNAGIRNAKGEFIGLLDSDDAWHPNFLERMIHGFSYSAEVDWIYCNARRVDSSGNAVIHSVFDDESSKEFRELKCTVIEDLNIINDPNLMYVAIKSTIKAGANSVLRRDVLRKVHYNPEMKVGVDRLLVIEAIFQ